MGMASVLPMAWMQLMMEAWVTPMPCCQSRVTASKPAWAMTSATYGLPEEHQPMTAGRP